MGKCDLDSIASCFAVRLGFIPETNPASAGRPGCVADLTARQRRLVEAMASAAVRKGGDSLPRLLEPLGMEATQPPPSDQTLVVADLNSQDTWRDAECEDEAPAAGKGLSVSPESFGRYQLRKEIGRGGQALVMLATDRHVGRQIAWKQLLSGADGTDASLSDSPRAQRFLREARITGRLEHPNIVPVHEVGHRQDGTLYYTMRLVHGETLDQKLSKCAGLSDRLALLGAFWNACKAMAFAHARGVIHRDVKPGNIMVGELGETVLLDWGLAKVQGVEDRTDTELAERASSFQLMVSGQTIAGFVMGTPCYMSPEQARGEIDQVGTRSDVWSLGAVLYQILTGKVPFEAKSAREVMFRVQHEEPRPVSEVCPKAPVELAAIATKALRQPLEERYSDAQAMTEDVAAFMTGGRVQAHNYRSWELLKRFAAKNQTAILAAALVVLSVCVGLVTILYSYRREARAFRQERLERQHAHYHLAQAYARAAERLAAHADLLNARIFAAASIINNPTYSASPFHDPSFLISEPEALWLQAQSSSLIFGDAEPHVFKRLVRTLRMDEPIVHSARSLDGKLLVAADTAGMVSAWELDSGRERRRFLANPFRLSSLAISPDNKQIATTSKEGLCLWGLDNAQPQLFIPPSKIEAVVVAYSPDGQLAIGERSGKVITKDPRSGMTQSVFPSHSGEVVHAAFSDDGRWFASVGNDRKVLVSNAQDGSLVHVLKGHRDEVSCFAFSSDGHWLATGSNDKTVRLWDVETGQSTLTLPGSSAAVLAVTFSPDGRHVAAGTAGREVLIWETNHGSPAATHAGHGDAVLSLSYGADGKTIVSSGLDREIRIWELTAGASRTSFDKGGPVTSLAYSSDGQLLVSAGSSTLVRLWNARTGTDIRALFGSGEDLRDTVISPDNRLVAASGFDKRIRIWDLESGALLRDMSGHDGVVEGIAFSPDGRMLASASRDRSVRLWDVATGKQLAELSGHGHWVWSVAFSPDGRRLATACSDRLVRLWDVESRAVVMVFEGHRDWATSVDFSADGRFLYSSGKDRTAIRWDTATGRAIVRYSGHRQWVNSVAVSRDGRMLVTGSDDGLAAVWDAATGRPLLHLNGKGAVSAAEFAPDAREIAIASDRGVFVFPLDIPPPQDPQQLLREAENAAGMHLQDFELTALDAR